MITQQIRHLRLLTLIAGLSLTSLPVSADNMTQQRWQFLNALEALKTKNFESFQQFNFGLQNYPLYHYLRYKELQPYLEYTPASEVAAYLKRYGDTWFGNALRKAWLKILAGQKDWSNYLRFYTPQSDKTLLCHYAQARLMTGQSRRAAIEDGKKLWLVDHSQASACDPVFEYLYQTRQISDAMLWERIGMAMKKGRTKLARAVGKHLTLPIHQEWFALWQQMHRKPGTTLAELTQPDLPLVRQIIIHGLKRLARKQFDNATTHWESLQQRYAFSMSEIGEVQRALAEASVKQKAPTALKWLTAVNQNFLTDKFNQTRIMFALKKQNWSALEDFTIQVSSNDKDYWRWQYWLGRAYEQQGKVVQARQVFKRLTAKQNYYGFLATNRLGKKYQVQHRPIRFTPADKVKLMRIPSIAAAHEFFQLSKLPDEPQQQWVANARNEWHYAIKKFDKDQKAVAAALASRWHWYDRALVTAARAGHYHDLEIRFPLAFYHQLATGARRQNIDLAWVYGIVRQESAFMDKVRSRAGAMGLMQVMPATGRYVAKKIGLKLNNTQEILNIDTNISLGTSYLRQMLEKFNGNYMLATAAYNAGPNRAKRWAKERGCFPADLWVELIPFKETRKYVRRVLFYTTIFESRLGQRPRPMRLHLSAEEHCTLNYSGQPDAAQTPG